MKSFSVGLTIHIPTRFIKRHVFWLLRVRGVEDLSVQLIKCYKGQLYINIQDKATSVIAIVPK